jgi:hypothetical protein
MKQLIYDFKIKNFNNILKNYEDDRNINNYIF